MRYALALAPFVAAAFAQSGSSSEETSTSTYTYSNTMTNFLSETNSLGVVTGMPTLTDGGVVYTSQPALPPAMTSQPALATIPAGLPTGINTVYIGGGNHTSATSFLVSVGSSTTEVLGASATIVSGSVVASSASQSSASGSSNDASSTSGNSPSGTESAATETSSGAADSLKLASGAVLGVGALFAVFL